MGKDIKQFKAAEDGCVYFYDKAAGCYRKLCDIPSFDDLPPSVRRQIREARADAAEVMMLPMGRTEVN